MQGCIKTRFYEHRFSHTSLFAQLLAKLPRMCECLSAEVCEEEYRGSRRAMRCEDFDKDVPINGTRGRQRKLTISFNHSSVPFSNLQATSANSWK